MNNEEKRQLAALLAEMQNASMDFRNFNGQSAFGYEGSPLGYDADMFNYDADALNFNNQGKVKWTDEEIASANLTTYKARVFYTPFGGGGGGVEPVNVTFFLNKFNGGTFNANGDLVFTNSIGDTATIRGLTTSMETIMGLSETEPFNLAFIRMTPKSATQLENPIEVLERTQWNSSKTNEINPDIYIDPYQFQLLRVDVPFNMPLGNKYGFSWNVDADQTGTGCGLAFFIGETLDPVKALQNKPIVRNLGATKTPFFTPSMPMNKLREMIAKKEVQALSRPAQPLPFQRVMPVGKG